MIIDNAYFPVKPSIFPIVNRINPAAIISDCFYSLCVFEDMNMYIRCIASMGVWTVVLAVCSVIILRREKYANL